MKAKIAILTFFVTVVFSCSVAHGASDEIFTGMGKKISRGLTNVFTGWIELPMQTVKGYKQGYSGDENNKVMGSVCGFFKGISCTIGRTAWGVVELVGFWAANPQDNSGVGIMLDNEYAWEVEETTGGDVSSDEEVTFAPIGKKLARGLGNSLFGFTELPGQILKGLKTNAPDLGVIKGLWFWYSREIYGFADILTIVFPTPEDNPGYPFDEEYPWDAMVDTLEK